jgi:hypothetical protein
MPAAQRSAVVYRTFSVNAPTMAVTFSAAGTGGVEELARNPPESRRLSR